VSEQNPSEAFPPQPPQQSFGAAQPPPQQSFGQAPPGQGSFGAAPPPGQPGQPGEPMPAAEPAPKKKSGAVRAIVIVAVLVVLSAVGVGGWLYTTRNAAGSAQVGDCLAGTTPEQLDASKLKKVDCTASDAPFKVVERIPNKTESEANSACTESTEDRWVFWTGKTGQTGTVLCLGRNTP
jgi:hypothetical protein